jgi:hypothetical protein
MHEQNLLRYRLEVVQMMPEGPHKAAVIAAILARMESLRRGSALGIR